MELNRNYFFTIGLVLLFLGIQMRMVDSFVLNETGTRLARRLPNRSSTPLATSYADPWAISTPLMRHSITPPKWLGWGFISVAGVMVMQSLVMRRPG